MVHVVIINGCGGVGKDTFVEQCRKCCSYKYRDIDVIFQIMNYSTVDKIKEIAKKLGWDGAKTEKDRKFLSDLKELTSEYNDFSYNETIRRIREEYKESSENYKNIKSVSIIRKFLFIHCREPKDIQRIVDFCKTEFVDVNVLDIHTLLIRNNRVKNITSNIADANVENYEYDYIIDNDSDIQSLEEKAQNFLISLLYNNENMSDNESSNFFDSILKAKNKYNNSMIGDISSEEIALSKQADIISRIYDFIDNIPDNPLAATIQNSILNMLINLCIYDIDTLKKHKDEFEKGVKEYIEGDHE